MGIRSFNGGPWCGGGRGGRGVIAMFFLYETFRMIMVIIGGTGDALAASHKNIRADLQLIRRITKIIQDGLDDLSQDLNFPRNDAGRRRPFQFDRELGIRSMERDPGWTRTGPVLEPLIGGSSREQIQRRQIQRRRGGRSPHRRSDRPSLGRCERELLRRPS